MIDTTSPARKALDIVGLRAKAEKATPGPWRYCGQGQSKPPCSCGYIFGDGGEAYIAKTLTLADDVDPVTTPDGAKANAAHIAAFDPLTVLALLDEIDALRAALEAAEGKVGSLTAELAEAKQLGQAVVDAYANWQDMVSGEANWDAAMDALAAFLADKSTVVHRSDCAIYNAPAYAPGPCDCGASPSQPAPEEVEPVAWRVKDFADGWIMFSDNYAALKEMAETGAVVQPLYAATPRTEVGEIVAALLNPAITIPGIDNSQAYPMEVREKFAAWIKRRDWRGSTDDPVGEIVKWLREVGPDVAADKIAEATGRGVDVTWDCCKAIANAIESGSYRKESSDAG